MRIKDLSPEQRKKARACNTPEEMLEFVKEEGLDLSPEQLDAIAGGNGEGNAWNYYTPALDAAAIGPAYSMPATRTR